jgi:hypothetical protein
MVRECGSLCSYIFDVNSMCEGRNDWLAAAVDGGSDRAQGAICLWSVVGRINMALIWSIISVSCSILVTPFLMFLLAIIFLASIGKSLGVRRLYVKMLLKIFEVSINSC